MYGTLLRALFPAIGIASRQFLWFRYRELEKTQWLSRNEIRLLQQRKLRRLISHAYSNVPYYHRKLKQIGLGPFDIQKIEDIQKLPILKRDDIRMNLRDLVARNIQEKRAIPFSTAGSTGEPLKFYVSRKSREWGIAAQLRAHKWCGVLFGDKILQILGIPPGTEEPAEVFKNAVLRRVTMNCYAMSEDSMKNYARIAEKFRPKAIIGFASAIDLFAKYVRECAICKFRPEAVITTGEMLLPEQRKNIGDTFDCDVFDFYGSREVLSLASECPAHDGYHISAENVLLEFVKNKQQTSSDEIGAVLVTDLNSYEMPFIRYENGDLACSTDQTCSCGRQLPLIRAIEGRKSDVIVLPDGRFVSTPGFTHVFKDLPVDWYQIVQETRTRIVVKVLRNQYFSQDHANLIVKNMQEYVGNVDIELVFVDSKPLSRSGKSRVVISQVPPSFVD